MLAFTMIPRRWISRDQPVVLGHLVLPLAHLGQGLLVDALEAHEQAVAAGGRHEVEKGQVVHEVHAHGARST